MALKITNITREFLFQKNGKEMPLNDPNPALSPADVMKFYAGIHPELTTGTVEGPKIEASKAKYEFKTSVGTKG